MFFARVKGKHYKTGNLVEVKTMMHLIKGDTMLLSRRSLWKLGVVEDEFPQIGKYLKTAGIEAVKSEPTPSLPDSDSGNDSELDEENNQSVGIENKPKDAVIRQPVGECDSESELPCSCPRRRFVAAPSSLPMPAVESNREALEDFIKDHYRAGAFNVCKRQPWPVT